MTMKALRGLPGRLGWTALAGLACLGAALLLQASLGRHLQRQHDTLQAELAAAHERLRIDAAAGAPRDNSAPAQLARFHAGFPNLATSADWLARVQQAAQRSGLELQSGEYRLEQRGSERLQRYTIVLPVSGSYAQIRHFVDAALEAVPSLALEDIELRRDSAAAPALEGRVRLTLYLRAAP